MVATGGLGCGDTEAWISCRGGADLVRLPFSQLNYGRRLDDMSDASVAVGHFTGNGALVPPGFITDECCGVLAELEPWEHEITVYRNGELVWCGPVVKVDRTTETMSIMARDLFQWFERRLLLRDRDFEQEDLATIFHVLAVDALHRDVTPNIDLSGITPTGVLGDRTINSDAYRRAADEMRELLRSGLDMTMVNRVMRVGGVEVPTANLGTLLTEHFDGLVESSDGLQTETESVVVGASTDTVLGPVSAIVGSPVVSRIRTVDPQRGLIQNVVTESGIEDEDSALAAAQSRHELLSESLSVITGRLLPNAPVTFDQLIPGATADLALRLFCRSIRGDYRLQSLAVTVDQDGVEKIVPTFTDIGTTLEV